ncbi:MAG TPA: glycosyltransferase family 4 protein [Limnochordia bacterium]|nr:glycosyltransferase family 4 protein [Limnochordia bacterium]
MKVLLLSDFFLSGQTTHVLELAKQLKKLGIEPHIAFGTIHTKLFWSDYVPYLQRHRISFSRSGGLKAMLVEGRLLAPDLIHAQSSTLFQQAQVLSHHLKIPYLVTCHGLGFNQPRFRHFLASASAIIAIGPKVAEQLSEFRQKVHIIPNGIDTDVFAPPPGRSGPRRALLYVGRLEKKRLEPLRYLAEANSLLVGTPLKIISNFDPEIPGTVYLPWQVNLVPHLQSSGIVAACGRTAREALSCGNAVLLMQQAYDGVISPRLVKQDDFDFSGNLGRYELADLKYDLHALLHRPHRLKKLQNWGRSYAVSHLSSSEMAAKTAALYKLVLHTFKPAPPSWQPAAQILRF